MFHFFLILVQFLIAYSKNLGLLIHVFLKLSFDLRQQKIIYFAIKTWNKNVIPQATKKRLTDVWGTRGPGAYFSNTKAKPRPILFHQSVKKHKPRPKPRSILFHQSVKKHKPRPKPRSILFHQTLALVWVLACH
jgi:hypothetical protein